MGLRIDRSWFAAGVPPVARRRPVLSLDSNAVFVLGMREEAVLEAYALKEQRKLWSRELGTSALCDPLWWSPEATALVVAAADPVRFSTALQTLALSPQGVLQTFASVRGSYLCSMTSGVFVTQRREEGSLVFSCFDGEGEERWSHRTSFGADARCTSGAVSLHGSWAVCCIESPRSEEQGWWLFGASSAVAVRVFPLEVGAVAVSETGAVWKVRGTLLEVCAINGEVRTFRYGASATPLGIDETGTKLLLLHEYSVARREQEERDRKWNGAFVNYALRPPSYDRDLVSVWTETECVAHDSLEWIPITPATASDGSRSVVSYGVSMVVADLQEGSDGGTLPMEVPWAQAAAFSPDGKRLASTVEDGSLRIWDVASGACTSTFESEHGCTQGLAWAPDGMMVYNTDKSEEALRVWDLRDLIERTSDNSPWIPGPALQVSPDGSRALNCGLNRSGEPFRMVNLSTLRGMQLDDEAMYGRWVDRTKPLWSKVTVRVAVFSRDGSKVYLWPSHLQSDYQKLVLDARDGSVLDRVKGRSEMLLNREAVALSVEGTHVLLRAAQESKKEFIWSIYELPEERLLRSFSAPHSSCAAVHRGNVALVPAGSLLFFRDGAAVPETLELSKTATCTSVAFSPDGTKLSVGLSDGRLLLLSL